MAGQEKIVVSNDPARVSITGRRALEYAERAYAEGRISDAERLIDIAHQLFGAAYARASSSTAEEQPAPIDNRLVEP